MGCAFYWASNDGVSGHIWLSDGDLRALTDEMLVQGMPWPVERVGAEAVIDPDELKAALDPASAEPKVLGDAKLWLDWLRFLEGAARSYGTRSTTRSGSGRRRARSSSAVVRLHTQPGYDRRSCRLACRP